MEESRFEVEFIDEEAENQFLCLPKSAKKLIKTAIEERLEVDPIKYGKPLRYNLKGYRRIRVSVYRIVYKVDMDQRLVIISVIDYRRDVYDWGENGA